MTDETDQTASLVNRLDRTLDELEAVDDARIDRELARRLADRIVDASGAARPPHHVAELRDREGHEAETELDPELELEVARYWFEGDVEFEPSVRVRNGRSSLAIEIPAGVDFAEPPSVDTERLDPEIVAERDLDHDELSRGAVHSHLDLSFEPELVERSSHELEPGEDRPDDVFSPDDRYVFRDTDFPWCTTGRIETPGGSCTGTMIGENLVLTASHCIDWRDDGAGWVKFTPAFYDGNAPFGQAWGERLYYWNRAQGGLSNTETAFDYVVVKLDKDLGNRTGYPGYRTYDSSWNDEDYWQHIGYPGDMTGSQRPIFIGDGEIERTHTRRTSGRRGTVMGHYIDTDDGQSGGPYWGWWGDEPWPRIVGVHSASPNSPGPTRTGDNEAGGGPALSALIGYARDEHH